MASFRTRRAPSRYPRNLVVLAYPGSYSPRLSGALNLYSRSANGLDNLDKDLILLLATHASLAVATTHAVSTGELREAQLHRAIDSRDVIGQAKGVLMHRRGISAG